MMLLVSLRANWKARFSAVQPSTKSLTTKYTLDIIESLNLTRFNPKESENKLYMVAAVFLYAKSGQHFVGIL